jgi:hypothetical protein
MSFQWERMLLNRKWHGSDVGEPSVATGHVCIAWQPNLLPTAPSVTAETSKCGFRCRNKLRVTWGGLAAAGQGIRGDIRNKICCYLQLTINTLTASCAVDQDHEALVTLYSLKLNTCHGVLSEAEHLSRLENWTLVSKQWSLSDALTAIDAIPAKSRWTDAE